MDRYQKVEKPRVETPIDANEIRITSQGRMRSYITYAMTLLQVIPLYKDVIFCLEESPVRCYFFFLFMRFWCFVWMC